MIAVPISFLQCPGIQMSVFIIQLTVVLVSSYQIVERDASTVPRAVLKAILMAANSEIFKAVTTKSMIFHTVSFSGKVILSHCARLHLARGCENHVVENPKDYIWWANKRHPRRKMQITVTFSFDHNFSIKYHKVIIYPMFSQCVFLLYFLKKIKKKDALREHFIPGEASVESVPIHRQAEVIL